MIYLLLVPRTVNGNPNLRKKAMSLDDVPLPPLDRRFWALTPPVPGFKPEAYPDDDED